MNGYTITALVLALVLLAIVIDPLQLRAPNIPTDAPAVETTDPDASEGTATTSQTDFTTNPMITLNSPTADEVVESPLMITGEARGMWYFEATFPIVLTDWDGRIIAEHYATASGTWMTEDFVPFSAEVAFESPYQAGDPEFMQRGSLILQRANPSDLPENDAAIEIPVRFAPAE